MYLNKINKLKNGNQLFFWSAHNKGRGRDNATLTVVPARTERASFSTKQINIITMCRTCDWRGDVNLSKAICNKLGITLADIIFD